MDGPRPSKESLPLFAQESKLVAALAHDICSPLESLRNLLYLLQCDPTLSVDGQSQVKLADEQAQRIAHLTRTAVCRFGDADCPEDANVPELLRSVLEFYASRFASRGIAVNTRYCADGDMRVYPGPLRQAFANLVLNAADSMPAGGEMYARVSVAHEWAGDHRPGLRVTFADNGCGISAEDLPNLGRPFFTTKGKAGTGIGLATVRDTVQKHGGALRIRSNNTKGHSGSVFTIFLPCNKLG